jgi:hypothetical protein
MSVEDSTLIALSIILPFENGIAFCKVLEDFRIR